MMASHGWAGVDTRTDVGFVLRIVLSGEKSNYQGPLYSYGEESQQGDAQARIGVPHAQR